VLDRKVKSATRPDEDFKNNAELAKAKGNQPNLPEKRENPKINSPGGTKITDRPSSASAG